MEFFTNNFINKYLAFSNVNIHRFAVRLLRHKCYALWRPIKLQIHLWTNRKRLSPVEYSCACCGSGAYTSRCTLHLSYATDCRMLLTFVLRSKLCIPYVSNEFHLSLWMNLVCDLKHIKTSIARVIFKFPRNS
jgi:hypothetical protein